jgi:mRNA interferase MazF
VTHQSPRRGEVWLAQLDKGNLLHAVIGAPVTSTVRGLSTEVPVGPSDGVRLESVANLDNLQLVARSRLLRRVGRARASTMTAICSALSIAVGCD